MRKKLLNIYKRLYNRFGAQEWWPGKTPFEVIIGAILTQNTSWSNVEKAIRNLKRNGLLSPRKLSQTPDSRIASLIRPSGYYNIKARRIRNFLDLLDNRFGGSVRRLLKEEPQALRKALLGVSGIGPETADCILLYAAEKPFFVIDAYTKRLFIRHGIIGDKTSAYDDMRHFFMSNLPKSVRLYNEYHALIVRTGKDFCKKRPKCGLCPLRKIRRK